MSNARNIANLPNGDDAPVYACRAWVNFVGTSVTNPASTAGINAQGNVVSLFDNGTGDYTVNFTNAMPDANYAISGSSGSGNTWGSYDFAQQGVGSNTAAGSCRFNTYVSQTAGKNDVTQACLIIHR